MSRYGITTPQPGPERRSPSPRLYNAYVPYIAAPYAPEAAQPQLPVLASIEWQHFERDVGVPEDPYTVSSPYNSDYVYDRRTDYEKSVQAWAEAQAEPEGEEPYATRDYRNKLTRLQWKILTKCAQRSGHTTTPPHKWTTNGIQEAYEAYAEPDEMRALLAEQDGRTKPIPFRTKNLKGEVIDLTSEDEVIKTDPEDRFFLQQQRDISPARAELESASQRARDPVNNPALRLGRRNKCYPCYQEKRTCNVNKRENPTEICEFCAGQDFRGKSQVPFDAYDLCQIIPGPAAIKWVQDKKDRGNRLKTDGWEAEKQKDRDAKARGERSHVGNRAAKNRAKKDTQLSAEKEGRTKTKKGKSAKKRAVDYEDGACPE